MHAQERLTAAAAAAAVPGLERTSAAQSWLCEAAAAAGRLRGVGGVHDPRFLAFPHPPTSDRDLDAPRLLLRQPSALLPRVLLLEGQREAAPAALLLGPRLAAAAAAAAGCSRAAAAAAATTGPAICTRQ